MPLHPQAQQLLAQLAGMGSMKDLPIEDARAMVEATAALAGPLEEVHTVEDVTISGPAGDIPARVYHPADTGPRPIVVNFHGGGWTYGSIELDDHLCRTLANGVGGSVVSVGYRLAPEHRFPAAADDAYTATLWAQTNANNLGGDPRRVAVIGESAGGNLAAATALRFRDEGLVPLRFQALIYPALDSTMSSRSYDDYADGYFLTRDLMAYAWREYAANDLGNPYASPMNAEDLTGLPPALVLSAEYDPLRGEAERYVNRLQAAGVDTRIVCYPGMVHGFVGMGAVFDEAKLAVGELVATLRQALGTAA